MGDQRFDVVARVVQTVPSRRRLLGGSLAVALALGLAARVEDATAGNVKKRLKKRERQEDALQLERNQNIANALSSMAIDLSQLKTIGEEISSIDGLENMGWKIAELASSAESKRAQALEWVW